jgi:hypothetical protein
MFDYILDLKINSAAFPDVPKDYLIEMLGVLPHWASEYDVHGFEYEDLKEFMERMYGWNLHKFEGEVLASGNYKSKYDEDPVMPWVGQMQCTWGTIYFYESAILALPMPNGVHFITRMD